MVRRVLTLLALALALMPEASAAQPRGGTFRVAEPATYIDSIDGALAFTAADLPFLNLACASLLRLADRPLPAGFRVVPELAGFPQISRDGKTYVFTLRSGLRFNTGATVTAADVAFTINRLLELKSPYSPAFTGVVGAQAVLDGKAKQASGVVASGRRLTITLLRPDGGFVDNAAASLCVVPARSPLEPGGMAPPVPTAAPYYISEYVPGQRLVLERNPYYGGTRPHHVDSFVFDLTMDENQALDDALDGTADYAWAPNPYYSARAEDFAHRFGVNKTRFFVQPATFLRMFVFNTSRPLFRDNPELRRAINYAIDRRALIAVDGAYAGTAVDDYLPPIFPDTRASDAYPLGKPNLAKAKALAQGHTRGGKLVLYITNRGALPAKAQIIKQELARIGLDIAIHTWPPPILFQKIANPKEPFDMAFVGWLNTVPDPSLFLNSLFDGSGIGTPANTNYSYFNSPKWNKAFEAAARLSGEARYRAYADLDEKLAREEAPAFAYSVDNALTLVSARVGCIVVNPYLDLAAVCLK
jgi:peptide/nickel transport system substrate-binding protein